MKRACTCGLRVVPSKPERGHVRGRSSGSEVCGLATFKAWHQREIRRLGVRRITNETDAASVIREVCGTHLSEREHVVLIGLDRASYIRGIADGTSNERSLCSFNTGDAMSAVFRSHETIGAEKITSASRIVRFVIGHNHPGGDAQPSPHDIKTTEAFIEHACAVGVPLVEHMVVAAPGPPWPGAVYQFSMREQYGEALFKPCR